MNEAAIKLIDQKIATAEAAIAIAKLSKESAEVTIEQQTKWVQKLQADKVKLLEIESESEP